MEKRHNLNNKAYELNYSENYTNVEHKPELTTMGKSHIHHVSCWRQWLEESSSHGISVVKNMSGVHADVTFSTEEGTWSTVTTPDSRWITPTLLADVCCHMFPFRSRVYQAGSLCPPPL